MKTRLESYMDKASRGQKSLGFYAQASCYKCLKTLEEIRQTRGMGLLRVVDCKGDEQYICEVCFEGGE